MEEAARSFNLCNRAFLPQLVPDNAGSGMLTHQVSHSRWHAWYGSMWCQLLLLPFCHVNALRSPSLHDSLQCLTTSTLSYMELKSCICFHTSKLVAQASHARSMMRIRSYNVLLYWQEQKSEYLQVTSMIWYYILVRIGTTLACRSACMQQPSVTLSAGCFVPSHGRGLATVLLHQSRQFWCLPAWWRPWSHVRE